MGKIFFEGIVISLPQVDFEKAGPGGFTQSAGGGGEAGHGPVVVGGLAKETEDLEAAGCLKRYEGLPGFGDGGLGKVGEGLPGRFWVTPVEEPAGAVEPPGMT